MKKYVLISAIALALGACGGGDNDMTATPEAGSEDLLKQAHQAYESGDTATAIDIWQNLASAGDSAAQYGLATLYFKGEGVEKNEQMAFDLLTRSAEQGYTPALNDMGTFYLQQGRPDRAAPLLQAAAGQGWPPAQFNLGVMLFRGDGVEKNEQAGLELVRQAAAQGFVPAQNALQQAQQPQ